MLKKYGAELRETKGEDWLDDDFIMGVIMDLTAAGMKLSYIKMKGFYSPSSSITVISYRQGRSN